MSKKLQNVKAVNQMLTGEHQFQQKTSFNFMENEKKETRLVGETWEETDPKSNITYIMEQKDGYVMKTNKSAKLLQQTRDDVSSFANCRQAKCTCVSPNHLDQKMKTVHGMCFDCVVDMENELRLENKFNEYAVNKLTTNATEWLKRAERDIELLKEAYTRTYSVVSNSDGKTETVDARMTPEQFTEKVEKEFNEYRENFMTQLTKLETQND